MNRSKPNIVFLFTDDQRFDTINALGNNQIITPNLDKLVANGATFTHAHIPGGTCGAICMPSRAMLHTGRSLFHLDGEGQKVPEDHVLMGEFLQNLGYDCYGIGKWHNGSRSYARSFNGGDEIFFGGMWDHWNVPAHHYDPIGQYTAAIPYIKDAFHSKEVQFMTSDHIRPGEHSTDLFSKAAVNFVNKRVSEKDDKPFFLYLAYMAPHDPRSMPKEYLDMYESIDIDIPDNFAEEHCFDYGIRRVRDELLTDYPRTKAEVHQHLKEYYAMITHLDDSMGNIINALEAGGKAENTIFVMAGDNGLAVGQHGLFGKQSVYEHSIRVPLIFCGPGIEKGVISNQPCYLFDIFPTLAEFLGEQSPKSVDGISVAPILKGQEFSRGREAMYFAYENRVRAVKKGHFKLVEYAGENFRETQLFDLENDPKETQNLAKTRPDRVNEIRNDLLRLRDEWEDLSHPCGQHFWSYY